MSESPPINQSSKRPTRGKRQHELTADQQLKDEQFWQHNHYFRLFLSYLNNYNFFT